MPDRLIVAGFHRSGTSAVARLLHRAGLHLGDDLVGARASNPHGHFEDLEVVRLHNDLLARSGLTWQATASPPPLDSESRGRMAELAARRDAMRDAWAFKDPRATLFLDEWRRVLPSARFLAAIRHPANTVRSLHRREARRFRSGHGDVARRVRFWEEPGLALRMWLAYNRALLRFASEHDDQTLVISFARLRSGAPLIQAIRDRWALSLVPTATFEAVEPAFPTGEDPPLWVADGALEEESLDLWSRLAKIESHHWANAEMATGA